MLNSELAKLNTTILPAGFARDFDAHVYYTSNARPQAEQLREEMQREFEGLPVLVGDLVDACVGPHPQPMFEANFPKSLAQKVSQWLNQHRGAFSVLVHEVTGDDPKDHSQGAIWYGEVLALDRTKLDPSPKKV